MIKHRRKRRKGPIRMKEGELSVSWGYTREEGEDLYYTTGPGCSRADGRLLHYFFDVVTPSPSVLDPKRKEPCLVKELENRGYDVKTLRFTIQKKRPEWRSIVEV